MSVKYSIAIPFYPKNHAAASGSLSAPSTKQIVPVGDAFIAHTRRIIGQLSFEEDDKFIQAQNAQNADSGDEEIDDGLGGEQESKLLLASDPKLWKQQDHYAVLGLQALRYNATPEQIKRAHRRKVLRHHPDKKSASGGSSNDDSFFKCIAKAMEQLSDPVKRRSFDSVDPAVDDDDFPSATETTPENFYKLWTPVFEREARFSNKLPVPSLGDESTDKPTVESFYSFWYNFDSWRSYEYLDKDANEGSDSRDEKRHQEKKNKTERAARKKADNTRVRTLVDLALSVDPRIKAFKAAEKAAKAKPKATVAEAKIEEKKVDEAAEKAKAEEEAKKAADDKASREAVKKAKLAAAKNLKKEKKQISAFITSNNYFLPTGTAPSPAVIAAQLEEIDTLTSSLEPEQVADLRKAMEAASGPDAIKAAIVEAAGKVGGGKFKEFA